MPANFFMRPKLAAVQGIHPFLPFPLEPLIMLKIVRNQFLHDLVRGLAGCPILAFLARVGKVKRAAKAFFNSIASSSATQ